MLTGKIVKVSGPLVIAEGFNNANMFDVVYVGKDRLIGEIIEIHGDCASIQVYEETAGIRCGDLVESTGAPLSVELAPGLLETIYDGIERPLEKIRQLCGSNIKRGVHVDSIDRKRKWKFIPCVNAGDFVSSGDIIGTVEETVLVTHRIMLPHGVSGKVKEIYSGEFTVEDTVCKITTENGDLVPLTMLQKWPVRRGRPYSQKISPTAPIITGQRIIDFVFPLAKGGTAAVPGPFGSGKTVVQHQLAKWSDVDVVVYIGCGERGNEMTDVLREFPELKDPKSGQPLMKRTVLIANTSDMPVAAREASVYTGITIAEYYRDMGYDVAVIADSTSRWAEALREMSGRLEEMPGEEGYPAYLSSRLAQFYERAGCIKCISSSERFGSLTAIGAVSPPGGDISEPVSQATLRIVKVFWGLDSSLAYARHFPAINWLNSYSLYLDRLKEWFDEKSSYNFSFLRTWLMNVLQEENKLQEIVRLVGIDALSPKDRLMLETARIIREDFLQQNAFVETDSFTPIAKQAAIMDLIYTFNSYAQKAIERNISIEAILSVDALVKISRAKAISNAVFEKEFSAISAQVKDELEKLSSEEGE